MLSQPALTDILVKFQVQLYQLTSNAFAQLSKYFWAVMSFYSEPSIDGFAKRYELHYQPKKMDVDGIENFYQFGVVNFHARQRVKANSGHQEQMVCRIDESIVLLQGACACLLIGREICTCPALAYDWPRLSQGAPFQ
jgi:hypothetical protein